MTDETKEIIPRKIHKTDLKSKVEEELIHVIRQMDFSVNTKLPREEELAKMLGVSRITLRSVLDDLASKGMIFRKHGKGTFVNQSFFEMKASFNPVMHFSDMITNSGYRPRVEILDYRVMEAEEETSQTLGISCGEHVLRCDKIFYADQQICAVTRDFIPMSYLNGFPLEALETYVDSIFYFMYKASGKKLEWDKVELNAVYSQQVALLDRLLKKKGSEPKPFLLLKGVSYDEEGTAGVFTWEYVDTSILKYSQIRRRLLQYENADKLP